MPPFESAELVGLFTAYTAGPDSIGAHLAETVVRESARDPLLVATGTDLALFPGRRLGPGYRALPAVHPRIQGTGRDLSSRPRAGHPRPDARGATRHGCWRGDAAAPARGVQGGPRGQLGALWRDRIAVRAFAGREEAIAAMADYSCRSPSAAWSGPWTTPPP